MITLINGLTNQNEKVRNSPKVFSNQSENQQSSSSDCNFASTVSLLVDFSSQIKVIGNRPLSVIVIGH